MANERLYLVKTESGEELGPLDQDALIRLAQNGTITAFAKIRSVLFPRWEKAVDLPFLRPLLISQQEKALLGKKISFSARVWQRLTLRVDDALHEGGLVKIQVEKFESAALPSRFLAGLFDFGVVFSGVLLLVALSYILLKLKILSHASVAYVLLGSAWVWILLYFTLFMAWRSQTVGQKFWGVFLARRNGRAYYVGRAFFYTVFLLMFGLLTPLMSIWTGGKRGLQELFTATRMVKAKLVEIRR